MARPRPRCVEVQVQLTARGSRWRGRGGGGGGGGEAPVDLCLRGEGGGKSVVSAGGGGGTGGVEEIQVEQVLVGLTAGWGEHTNTKWPSHGLALSVIPPSGVLLSIQWNPYEKLPRGEPTPL